MKKQNMAYEKTFENVFFDLIKAKTLETVRKNGKNWMEDW